MTIHQLYPLPNNDEPEPPGGGLEHLVLERQPMAEALDRMRAACADLGLATLLAELDGVDATRAAAILDDVATTARRAVSTLRTLGTTARQRRALG